jgi:oligopeptide/dipeptide ABC transporter ATP-binding protein
VFNQLQNLFNDFISHLDNIVTSSEIEKVKNDGIAILEKLIKRTKEAKKRLPMRDAKQTAIKILEEVGIQDAARRFRQYPFELSGGMRQRIVIAIALLSNPDILICDEPTTALDVTIQAQILDLINKIKAERKLSVIFITHNLGVVANMADDIAVMYAGKIVEFGGVNDVFYNPKHPYTWALLASMPDLNTKDRLDSIPGTPPNMIIPPKGDAFAARNKYALKIDFEEEPPLFEVNQNHFAATWLLHENAPKVTPPKIVLQRMEELREYTASLKKKGGTKDAE